jgi:hypothetical protein
MSAKTQITGEFATPRDVASRLRIPAARVAELRLLMIELERGKTDRSMVFVEVEGPRSRQSARSKKK